MAPKWLCPSTPHVSQSLGVTKSIFPLDEALQPYTLIIDRRANNTLAYLFEQLQYTLSIMWPIQFIINPSRRSCNHWTDDNQRRWQHGTTD